MTLLCPTTVVFVGRSSSGSSKYGDFFFGTNPDDEVARSIIIGTVIVIVKINVTVAPAISIR
jgi:hypothetical protein